MSTFILFDDNELLHHSTTEEEDDIKMLFMSNETIIFKDGNVRAKVAPSTLLM